jgi:hypothetical protein|tara:strand:+ start:493 stop:702 length:210 start_codon:yes stop_codon:yes gene_type:complete
MAKATNRTKDLLAHLSVVENVDVLSHTNLLRSMQIDVDEFKNLVAEAKEDKEWWDKFLERAINEVINEG